MACRAAFAPLGRAPQRRSVMKQVQSGKSKNLSFARCASAVALEVLEGRRLLSGSPGFFGGGFGGPGGPPDPGFASADFRGQGGGHGFGGPDFGGGPGHGSDRSILFSQLPTTIQNGLTALAGTDGVTAPASTDPVRLGNSNGVETYSVDVTAPAPTPSSRWTRTASRSPPRRPPAPRSGPSPTPPSPTNSPPSPRPWASPPRPLPPPWTSARRPAAQPSIPSP